MKPDRKHLEEQLRPHGQEHVLTFWDTLADHERAALAEHCQSLNLPELVALSRSKADGDDWRALALRALPPPAVRLNQEHPATSPEQARQRGLEALAAGHVGVILVAGGQGSRLGFEHPKGMFTIGPVSGASLFQILIEKIQARSRASGMRIPLYLMTSPATHDETLAYLAANENFGLPREDLHVFCQGTMPAVDAASGRLLLADRHQLALSPDGHGGMLPALAKCGGLAEIRRRGLRQLFYCQIDNPLVEMCDPNFIGYHLAAGSELSTLVIAKQTPRDKVGNVVLVDGQLRIIEYSDLNPLEDEIVTRTTPGGEPVFWAGSIAIHVFDVPFLERMAQRGTSLPFHVAKKAVSHVEPSGQRVEPSEPNAIKFERFVFDLLPNAKSAIVVETDERQTFAPLKNASGDTKDTPESVQAQMIDLHTSWLRAAGCEVAEGVPVEISPLFAQNAEELAARVSPGTKITLPRYFR